MPTAPWRRPQTGDGSGALTAAVAMTYDPMGNLLTVDGPLPGAGDTSRIRYNAARQVVGTISADPDGPGAPLRHRAVRNVYDPSTGLLARVEQGNVESQSDPDWAAFGPVQAVETAYDSNARPVVTRLVSGSAVHALTQTGYDALGRPQCIAQRMNPGIYAVFTPLNPDMPLACALAAQGIGAQDHGPDRISKTVYDPAGRVIEVRTAVGITAAQSPDPGGQEAIEVATTYTASNLVETVTDAEGNRTTYEYDGHDRLWKTYYPMPSPKGAGTSNGADYEQLIYELLAGGARTSPLVVAFRNRAGQTIGFEYDSLGRTTLKNRPGSEPDVTYGYDCSGS